MKKMYILLCLVVGGVIFQSSTSGIRSSYVPPTGYTGASASYCSSCHNSYTLNTAGGGITASGLPTGSFVAGQAYPFSVQIKHATADRKRWGFSIIALDGNGNSVGTFTSANSNAAINGTELSHKSAVTTAASASYTYSNLNWTAPSTATNKVNFYYVGVAANNGNADSRDYVYAGSTAVVLPIKLASFNVTASANRQVLLNWSCATDQNSSYVAIEKSDDGQIFYNIGKVAITTNSNNIQSYTYTDAQPSFYGRTIFYRLKMVDKDNQASYSAVKSVSLSAETNATLVQLVYPTIVTKGATIHAKITSASTEKLTISLVTNTGNLIEQVVQTLQPGVNNITFNPKSNLAKGVAFLKFDTQSNHQTVAITVL